MKRMKPLILSTALVLGLVPALALASPAATKYYKVELAGSSVVPKQALAGGKGNAHFTLTGHRLCWRITVSGIDTPLAAHIHTGYSYDTGPAIVALGKHYQPAGCTSISDKAAVAIEGCGCGGVYVDVHTKRYPRGAIRGLLEVGR